LPGAGKPLERHVIRDRRPVIRGIERVLECETRVVGPRVVVKRAAVEAVLL